MAKMAFGLGLILLLNGCANINYYAQAIGGHIRLMQSVQAIPDLISDPQTDSSLRNQLKKVSAIRDFATRELGLPDNGSYRSYADLGRPYVVWNVFAASPLSTNLESWCFLFVGCVNYRGYYSHEAAIRFARELEKQGLETYVASIPAYSTLGFFDDPVLNTFLRYGEQEVARLLFHELAHQVVFVRGDSTFNESFATAVENEGMRRWLAREGDPDQYQTFEIRQHRKSQFQHLISEYRARLHTIYSAPGSPEEKVLAKETTVTELQTAYVTLKESWGGWGGYDNFFGEGINNAKLGSVSLYTTLVPAFEAMLEQAGHDLPSFYQQVEALTRLDKQERLAVLRSLQQTASKPRNI